MDSAEFNFHKHMLHRCYKLCSGRFDTVVVELQQACSARMWMLLGKIEGKVVLLWFVLFVILVVGSVLGVPLILL